MTSFRELLSRENTIENRESRIIEGLTKHRSVEQRDRASR